MIEITNELKEKWINQLVNYYFKDFTYSHMRELQRSGDINYVEFIYLYMNNKDDILTSIRNYFCGVRTVIFELDFDINNLNLIIEHFYISIKGDIDDKDKIYICYTLPFFDKYQSFYYKHNIMEFSNLINVFKEKFRVFLEKELAKKIKEYINYKYTIKEVDND